MHAQSRIAQESDVNLGGGTVDLIPIQSTESVVLGQARAVADIFAQGHMLVVPMRPACPGASEPLAAQCQYRAHDIVFRIPVAQPTAHQHGEYRLNIVLDHLNGGAVLILAGVAETADAGVTARTAPVSPQVAVACQSGDPLSFVCQGGNIVRSEERNKIPIAAGCE